MATEDNAFPLVSIIIPNHNHGHYIADALEAIALQSYPNKEIIVVDDGSTDNSVEVIKSTQEKYPFIRLFQPGKIGGNQSANLGFSHATGEFVMFCAADDMLLPGLIERSVSLLTAYPEAAVSFSEAKVLDVPSGTTSFISWKLTEEAEFLSPERIVTIMKRKTFWILGASSVWRARCFRASDGWDDALEWTADWFLSLALSFRFGACYIPEPLVLVRAGVNGYSVRGGRDPERRRRVFDALIKCLESNQYVDVVPKFRESRALSIHGVRFAIHLLRRGLRLNLVDAGFYFRVSKSAVQSRAIRLIPAVLRRYPRSG